MQMLVMLCYLLALSWVAPGIAFAQSNAEVEMTGQPLTYNKGGIITGCGIRVVGVTPVIPGKKTFKAFDVSANVWKTGASMVKMIGEERPVSNPLGGGRRQLLNGGWLKADGKTPAAGEFKESATDRGAYLFPADVDGAALFILAAATGKGLQVAVQWNKKTEWIYTGIAKLTDGERARVLDCLNEIAK